MLRRKQGGGRRDCRPIPYAAAPAAADAWSIWSGHAGFSDLPRTCPDLHRHRCRGMPRHVFGHRSPRRGSHSVSAVVLRTLPPLPFVRGVLWGPSPRSRTCEESAGTHPCGKPWLWKARSRRAAVGCRSPDRCHRDRPTAASPSAHPGPS